MTDYSSVLADLRSKRDKIDSTIQALEELSGKTAKSKPGSGEFKGMTIAAATIQFLKRAGEPQLTADIAAALKAGGLGSNSKSLYRTIYNTLVARMKQQKDITKAGSKWTLPE